jgi:hypothetical protein
MTEKIPKELPEPEQKGGGVPDIDLSKVLKFIKDTPPEPDYNHRLPTDGGMRILSHETYLTEPSLWREQQGRRTRARYIDGLGYVMDVDGIEYESLQPYRDWPAPDIRLGDPYGLYELLKDVNIGAGGKFPQPPAPEQDGHPDDTQQLNNNGEQ